MYNEALGLSKTSNKNEAALLSKTPKINEAYNTR